jgi:diketogulonate reductase-like aldo/keto reductase
VGQAIAAAMSRGLVSRSDLFLQTKFTFQRGQDHRLPYDARAPIGTQVEQSFASSLVHLGVETLDSYLLHGPTLRMGLVADDWAAWRAMEAIQAACRVKLLGVSNVSVEQLELLVKDARVKPSFVQNRCYADRGWDRDIRTFCAAHGIVYQGFSLLTANRALLSRPELARIARRYGRTVNQVVFRFCLEISILPLTGTSSSAHMREDLGIFNFALQPDEIQWIEHVAGG